MNMDWKAEFASRFRRHEDELKWLYCELYHNDQKAYDYFVNMLYRLWEERPEKLKMMDRAREEYPDWYKGHDLVGMLMYVNAFAGTLKGVRKKLDYITDCVILVATVSSLSISSITAFISLDMSFNGRSSLFASCGVIKCPLVNKECDATIPLSDLIYMIPYYDIKKCFIVCGIVAIRLYSLYHRLIKSLLCSCSLRTLSRPCGQSWK